MLGGFGYARYKASPAYGDYYRICLWHLSHNFKTDGARCGYDIRVVVSDEHKVINCIFFVGIVLWINRLLYIVKKAKH